MKRWLARISVFLLLGAIVNVAVAWRMVFVPFERTSIRQYEAGPNQLRRLAEVGLQPLSDSDCVHHWIDVEVSNGFATTFQSFRDSREANPNCPKPVGLNTMGIAYVSALGWPMRAVSCLVWQKRLSDTWGDVDAAWQISGGTFVTYDNGERPVPWRPHWPGFAINTVFYALILWLLFAGPFVLRRRRRIRRGLCPKCAYDLRGTPENATVCPECGAAALPKS